MPKLPYLDIDIDKIEENARFISNHCRKFGIEIAGVTKVMCGLPKVARAMLRGGVRQLADSRLQNIYRLREDGIRADIMLLRLPMLSEVDEVVRLANISLNSELKTIKALSEAAEQAGKTHKVILMVDLGDLREGVLPKDTLSIARSILKLGGVELHGIGSNLACLSGVQPSQENMDMLVYIANTLRKQLSIPLPMITGGNTFSLPLLERGGIPEGINHFRLGSSIIMNGYPTPPELMLHSDTIQLHAEVLEVKEKPSAPYGDTGKDAFGRKPVFEDKGLMKRAILGIGKEDIDPGALFPVNPKAEILGASSDHLVVNVTGLEDPPVVGEKMVFNLEYGAVLAAMTSKYVHKNIIYSPAETQGREKVGIIGAPIVFKPDETVTRSSPGLIREQDLKKKLTDIGLKVKDYGDLKEHDTEEVVAEKINNVLKKKEIPILLGGPHSIIHAELDGLSRVYNEFGLICFDAHGDLVTSILATDREIMPLSLENFVIIGVRDLTKGEKKDLEDSSITVFTMEDVDKLGMLEVMKQALDLTCSGVDGIHVSIDMDFVDIRDAPGVVEGAPGGISYREAHLAMELIAESKLLISADITEINPQNDPSGITIKLAVSLIATLLGKRILGK